MRRGTLLTEVLVVNLLLIAAAVLAAAIATNPDSAFRDSEMIGIVLGFALALTVAVNVFLLSRRFEPLEHLVEQMENADLSRPSAADAEPIKGSEEVQRLGRSFHEMLERLEAERRAGSHARSRRGSESGSRGIDLPPSQPGATDCCAIEAMRRTAPAEIRASCGAGGVAGSEGTAHARCQLRPPRRRLSSERSPRLVRRSANELHHHRRRVEGDVGS